MYGVREEKRLRSTARGVINDTFSGRIIFITTNSWLCTLAHILRVADKGRCYAARPWRINLLIKAIPLTPTGATTHLIRHRESNSGRPYGSSSFCNHLHRSLWEFLVKDHARRTRTAYRYHIRTNNLLCYWIRVIKCFYIDVINGRQIAIDSREFYNIKIPLACNMHVCFTSN